MTKKKAAKKKASRKKRTPKPAPKAPRRKPSRPGEDIWETTDDIVAFLEEEERDILEEL